MRSYPAVDPLATPRRIAIAGDWHGSGRWAHLAIQHALREHADVLIHLGDFGYTFERAFLETLDHHLAAAGLPLLFIDGNHDDHDWLARQPVGDDGLRRLSDYVWHLPRGFRWTWDGVRFMACGGAYSVDRQWRVRGVSWWDGEEISDTDVQRCTRGRPGRCAHRPRLPQRCDHPDDR